MIDPQQDQLYALEYEEFRGHCRHVMPLKKLRLWARRICAQFGVPRVKIRVWSVRGRGGSYKDCSIHLDPGCGRNALTLAHELAHHLTAVKNPRAQDHGATFCAYYAAILDGFRLVPIAGFKAVAKRYGVKVGRLKAAP